MPRLALSETIRAVRNADIPAANRGSLVTDVKDLLNHESVLERSMRLVAADAEVHRSFDFGRTSGEPRQSGSSWEAWRRAVPQLRAAMQAMYPDPLWAEVKTRLGGGDPTAREAALVFLEVDPWCFRSGYEKADLMKGLAKLELDNGEKERVRRVVLHVIQQPHRREFPRLVGLAASVWDPKLETDLDHVERTGDEEVRREVALLRNRTASRVRKVSLQEVARVRRTGDTYGADSVGTKG